MNFHHASRTSSILQGINFLGVATWVESSQTWFGLIGAILGALSAFMIVVINWDAFVSKKPVQRLLVFLRLARTE